MKRSKFNHNHYKLATMNMGYIVPIGWKAILPGDLVQHSANAFVRTAPMVAPTMHPVDIMIHHWFVPNRLVWKNWETFITGGPDNDNPVTHPFMILAEQPTGSLADYIGLQNQVRPLSISPFPIRAYNLIFNENYRDQDLQDPVVVSLEDGNDTTTNTTLLRANWQKDYFTMSRPWSQKGAEVLIPITGLSDGTTTDIQRKQNAPFVEYYKNATETKASAGAPLINGDGRLADDEGNTTSIDPNGSLYANLLDIGIDHNDMREALALNTFAENRARFGSRFTEYLAFLGIKSSDARLQRPEYLGGGQQTIQFSEVLQTAPGEDPVGSMKGHGISGMRSNRYHRFFEEHGTLMSVMVVRPRTMYTQGIERELLKFTKEEYWQKELQFIGQQEIYRAEIYADAAVPTEGFGWQDRYDEYRHSHSSVAGDFRNTMDNWHFARIFDSEPTLNSNFVQCEPAMRPFGDYTAHPIWAMVKHSLKMKRLVAKTGRPKPY